MAIAIIRKWLFITDDRRARKIAERNNIKSSGLQVKKVFGGFDGSNYEIDSNRMIVLAEKI